MVMHLSLFKVHQLGKRCHLAYTTLHPSLDSSGGSWDIAASRLQQLGNIAVKQQQHGKCCPMTASNSESEELASAQLQ